ncbi:MAG: hypothetical protein V4440_05400 [Pseudomonadota bacterium]
MTSKELLEAVATWLNDAGLLAGLNIKYYRWVDTAAKGEVDFALFRIAGGSGLGDSIVRQPDIKILIVGKESAIEATNNKADAIFKKIGGTESPDLVVKIEPLAVVMGPYFMDNGRCGFEINARCFVEGM